MIQLELRGTLLNRETRFRDLSPVMRQFAAYMQQQTDQTFERAGGPGSAVAGGEYRTVKWKPLSAKYRKRPSGARLTPLSSLLQDTGRLRQLAATEIVRITPTSLTMGTRLPYAAAQNARRPFLFMTDEDGDKFLELVQRHYGVQ